MAKLGLILLAAVPCLTACATGPAGKVASFPVDDVMLNIKKDLDNYSVYAAATQNAPPLPNACGGQIGFKVASVAIALTTITEVSNKGEAEVSVPIGGVTLGPSGSLSKSTTSSGTLFFTIVPKPADAAAAVAAIPLPEPGTFYAALRGLRESLLRTSATKPCFAFPPEKDQENSVKYGFTVVRDKTVGGKVSFLIFSLGAERTSSFTTGNTLTVNFVADPGSAAFTPN